MGVSTGLVGVGVSGPVVGDGVGVAVGVGVSTIGVPVAVGVYVAVGGLVEVYVAVGSGGGINGSQSFWPTYIL